MLQGLSILGSPRNNGNNAQILTKLKRNLSKEVKFDSIKISDLDIKPCLACGYCEENKGCRIDDEMQKIYPKFSEADLILVASPLYFNTVSAQLKNLIDRCQAFWANKLVLDKPLINPDKKRLGYFISTAGQKNNTTRFKYVKGTIAIFFKALDIDYQDNFFIGNIDQNPIKKRSDISAEIKKFTAQIKKDLKQF